MTKNILMIDELYPLRKSFLQNLITLYSIDVISDREYNFSLYKHRNSIEILALSPSFFDWTLDKQFLELFPKLRAICLSGGWHEHVDKDYCKARSIILTNVPGFSSPASAEWCIAVTIMLLRNLHTMFHKMVPVDSDFPGAELYGKTAGIIGMGGVGRALLKSLIGFGAECIYWSPQSRVEEAKLASLEEVVAGADVLYLTFYESDNFKDFINRSVLKTMRPTAVLVSGLGSQPGLECKCVDWNVAIEMTKHGMLGGLAIECGENEHIDLGCDRILISQGHSGWCTWEAIQRGTEIWINNILGVHRGTSPNVVDFLQEGH